MNEYIRSVNERDEKLPVTSPRFKLDLLRFRESKENKTHRVSYNFSVYKDAYAYQSARTFFSSRSNYALTSNYAILAIALDCNLFVQPITAL